MWLQLGGHCEPGDHTLLDAAAREAREESGIGSLSFDPTPLALDVHPITCSLGVPTRHFDVQFLAVAPPMPSRCAATSRSTCAGSRGTTCRRAPPPNCRDLVEPPGARLGL